MVICKIISFVLYLDAGQGACACQDHSCLCQTFERLAEALMGRMADQASLIRNLTEEVQVLKRTQQKQAMQVRNWVPPLGTHVHQSDVLVQMHGEAMVHYENCLMHADVIKVRNAEQWVDSRG